MTVPYNEWDGESGQRWLAHIDRFEGMVGPVGEALIGKAAFRPGETVVDVGCGGGLNSLQIARLVAPGGKVLGVDIAHMLIQKAEERAWEAGLGNVEFYCADAENAQLPMTGFDRLFARFGVMFFHDTTAAFAHMRSWLKPDASLAFSCWAPMDDNPWFGEIGRIVAKYTVLPPPSPDDPGPFRLSDPVETRAMLERAGFVDVRMELWKGEQPLGGQGSDPASAADFLMAAMPFSGAVIELPAAERQRMKEDLVALLAPHYRDGSIWITGAAWFVTARNPG